MEPDPFAGLQPDGIPADEVEAWSARSAGMGQAVVQRALSAGAGRGDGRRAAEIGALLQLAQLQQAQALVHDWLQLHRRELSARPSRSQAQRPLLWRALADVVERTSDQRLLEIFWDAMAVLRPAPAAPECVPLLGVPILNGVEHLERLLASLRQPVHTLALVDNSGAAGPVRQALDRLEQEGHPLVRQVRVARPFANLGVAASWNLILASFPEAAYALILNHDVVLTPEALPLALARLDPGRPQWLGLLPDAAAFSAFLITAPAWNRVGWFDAAFHPAYFEDLDYRDRLAADPLVEVIDDGPWIAAMAARNPGGSATMAADPLLAEQLMASYQLNRLWYLSRRRHQGRHEGHWLRLWLTSGGEGAA
jgi:hypothetical protein